MTGCIPAVRCFFVMDVNSPQQTCFLSSVNTARSGDIGFPVIIILGFPLLFHHSHPQLMACLLISSYPMGSSGLLLLIWQTTIFFPVQTIVLTDFYGPQMLYMPRLYHDAVFTTLTRITVLLKKYFYMQICFFSFSNWLKFYHICKKSLSYWNCVCIRLL